MPLSIGPSYRSSQEVHRGRSHEIGDEYVGRSIIDLVRASDLLELAILEDRDLRRESHCFHLIVRHIDDGCSRGP